MKRISGKKAKWKLIRRRLSGSMFYFVEGCFRPVYEVTEIRQTWPDVAETRGRVETGKPLYIRQNKELRTAYEVLASALRAFNDVVVEDEPDEPRRDTCLL